MLPASATKAPVIGLISDTHGLLRPEVATIFAGVERIVHAGDIGGTEILKALEAIAPLTAVSGNLDGAPVSVFLSESETFEFHSFSFYVLHNLSHLAIDPAASGIHMVISGHTHLPDVSTRDGVMYVNPGSAGPKRYNKPVTLAKVSIQEGRLWVKHIHL